MKRHKYTHPLVDYYYFLFCSFPFFLPWPLYRMSSFLFISLFFCSVSPFPLSFQLAAGEERRHVRCRFFFFLLAANDERIVPGYVRPQIPC